METLGFSKAIDNEGKWDGILSIIREQDEHGRLRRVKPQNYSPKGPYMKFLSDHDLLGVHIQDFMKRFGKKNLNTKPTPLPEYAYCDNWIGRNAIRLLNQIPESKPWHLVVNFTGPHDPWDITKRMKQRWKDVHFPPPHQGNSNTIREKINVRQNYAAMLENIDRNIGLILDEIRKRNELENTIIIYTSDHGEMLGDFERYGKIRPERGAVSIPLVCSGSLIRKSHVSKALVELQDLTATLLEYAGIPPQDLKDSLSLRNILEGSTKIHRDYQISAIDLREVGLDEWKMISDGEYKLVVENQNKKRLYNLKSDPWENENISKKNPQIIAKLLKMSLDN